MKIKTITFKNLSIETDGTSMGTNVKTDGEPIKLLTKVQFCADITQAPVKVTGVAWAIHADTLKKEKVKVRFVPYNARRLS